MIGVFVFSLIDVRVFLFSDLLAVDVNKKLQVRQEYSQDRYPRQPCLHHTLHVDQVYKLIGECVDGIFYVDPCTYIWQYDGYNDADSILMARDGF